MKPPGYNTGRLFRFKDDMRRALLNRMILIEEILLIDQKFPLVRCDAFSAHFIT